MWRVDRRGGGAVRRSGRPRSGSARVLRAIDGTSRDTADLGTGPDWSLAMASLRRLRIFAAFVLVPTLAVAADPTGAPATASSSPRPPVAAAEVYWQRAAGAWVGEAGYLDGELAPNVKLYGAVLDIRLEGGVLVQTEWKYYPASPLASQMAAALAGVTLAPGEGLEQISALRGTPSRDGAVDFGPEAGSFVPAGDATAVGTVRTDGAVRYRHFYTFPADGRMIRATFGFAPDGSLKGVSVFRFRRVVPDTLAGERARLRERFGVVLEIDRTTGAPKSRRLDR
jgi:hypothetical protein